LRDPPALLFSYFHCQRIGGGGPIFLLYWRDYIHTSAIAAGSKSDRLGVFYINNINPIS
jgi:hypothetical protein